MIERKIDHLRPTRLAQRSALGRSRSRHTGPAGNMTTYRQPHETETPDALVTIVLLGNEQAGHYNPGALVHLSSSASILSFRLYTHIILRRLPTLPYVKYGGPCFPIAIYCRSSKEADEAWRLQPLVRQLATSCMTQEEVVRALLTSPLAIGLFGERHAGQQEFYAVLFSTLRCPCIFFNW